jgi:hypothetical protein
MVGYQEPLVGPRMAVVNDEVELHLLLPSYQLSALEQAAARSVLTVPAVLRRAIGDFLRATSSAEHNDAEGRPSGTPEGIR